MGVRFLGPKKDSEVELRFEFADDGSMVQVYAHVEGEDYVIMVISEFGLQLAKCLPDDIGFAVDEEGSIEIV